MKQIILTLLFLATPLLSHAQEWEQLAGIPDQVNGTTNGRHHPVTFSINGLGYVLTGANWSEGFSNMFRYDPLANSWTQLADFPGGARAYAYGISYEQYAFVGFGNSEGQTYNDLWRYDSTTDTWEEMTACPCTGRSHPAFVRWNDKIYVGMGDFADGNLKDWWEYDMQSNQWSEKTEFPGYERHHPYFFEIGDHVYVGFGHGDEGDPNIYNDFYRYAPATDSWEQLADFPGSGRVAGTQFSYQGRGYILSGEGENHTYLEEGEFWEYFSEFDLWIALPYHPGSGRWAPGSFVIDNYVYLTGGLSSLGTESDLLRYQLSEPLVPTALQKIPVDETAINLLYGDDAIRMEGWTDKITKAVVVDITGQVIFNIVQDGIIDTKDLKKGYYILHFPENNIAGKRFLKY